MLKDLENRIRERQSSLQALVKMGKQISDPDVYELSCQIDSLVVEYMRLKEKKKIKKEKGQPV